MQHKRENYMVKHFPHAKGKAQLLPEFARDRGESTIRFGHIVPYAIDHLLLKL